MFFLGKNTLKNQKCGKEEHKFHGVKVRFVNFINVLMFFSRGGRFNVLPARRRLSVLIMEMCFLGGWVMSEGGEHFEFDFVRAAGCWEIEMGL